jgi:hypothetical protein
MKVGVAGGRRRSVPTHGGPPVTTTGAVVSEKSAIDLPPIALATSAVGKPAASEKRPQATGVTAHEPDHAPAAVAVHAQKSTDNFTTSTGRRASADQARSGTPNGRAAAMAEREKPATLPPAATDNISRNVVTPPKAVTGGARLQPTVPSASPPASPALQSRLPRMTAREEEEAKKEEAVAFMHSRLVALLKFEDDFEIRYVAARRAQCAIRCFLARRSLQRRKKQRRAASKAALMKETASARTLVRFLRLLRDRRREREARQKFQHLSSKLREHKAIVIQCAARKFIARCFVRRLRRYKKSVELATRVIQRATRCFLARLRTANMRRTRSLATGFALIEERRRRAATKIQAVYRRHHTAIQLLLRRGDLKAAREKGWVLGRSTAAKRIQRLFRGYRVRKVYRAWLKDANQRRRNRERAAQRLRATLKIQAVCRARDVRRVLRRDYRQFLIASVPLRAARQHRAAIIIQCCYRSMDARLALRRRRAERHRQRLEDRDGVTAACVSDHLEPRIVIVNHPMYCTVTTDSLRTDDDTHALTVHAPLSY